MMYFYNKETYTNRLSKFELHWESLNNMINIFRKISKDL